MEASVGHVREAMCSGAYDLSVGGLKFAGTAGFARRRESVYWLVHASLFVECDLAESLAALTKFERAIGCPRTYRDNKHANLADFLPRYDPAPQKSTDFTRNPVAAPSIVARTRGNERQN
jgi:lipoate-protein ligase A